MPCILIESPGQRPETKMRGGVASWAPGAKSDHVLHLKLFVDANPANDSQLAAADQLQTSRPPVPGATAFDGDAIADDRLDDLCDQVLAALYYAPGYPRFGFAFQRQSSSASDRNHHTASGVMEITITAHASDCLDRPSGLPATGTPISGWSLWAGADPAASPPTTGSP